VISHHLLFKSLRLVLHGQFDARRSFPPSVLVERFVRLSLAFLNVYVFLRHEDARLRPSFAHSLLAIVVLLTS
jgi:hypothetical protein